MCLRNKVRSATAKITEPFNKTSTGESKWISPRRMISFTTMKYLNRGGRIKVTRREKYKGQGYHLVLELLASWLIFRWEGKIDAYHQNLWRHILQRFSQFKVKIIIMSQSEGSSGDPQISVINDPLSVIIKQSSRGFYAIKIGSNLKGLLQKRHIVSISIKGKRCSRPIIFECVRTHKNFFTDGPMQKVCWVF